MTNEQTLCQGPNCNAVIPYPARYCCVRCEVEARGYPEDVDYEALILGEDEDA